MLNHQVTKTQSFTKKSKTMKRFFLSFLVHLGVLGALVVNLSFSNPK